MDGMPYSFNVAVLKHPDMKEFVEGQWQARLRYSAEFDALKARIRELEAERDAAVLAEREACARLIEGVVYGRYTKWNFDDSDSACDSMRSVFMRKAASAIRARGDK